MDFLNNHNFKIFIFLEKLAIYQILCMKKISQLQKWLRPLKIDSMPFYINQNLLKILETMKRWSVSEKLLLLFSKFNEKISEDFRNSLTFFFCLFTVSAYIGNWSYPFYKGFTIFEFGIFFFFKHNFLFFLVSDARHHKKA